MREVFDDIRSCWVSATSEEIIRQLWLRKMVLELGYPKELIAVEKELKSFPHLFHESVPDRRLDILCYHKNEILSPLLLIECKAIPLTSKALDQVLGYNTFIQAPVVAVVNERSIYLRYHLNSERYELSHLPSYSWFKERLDA